MHHYSSGANAPRVQPRATTWPGLADKHLGSPMVVLLVSLVLSFAAGAFIFYDDCAKGRCPVGEWYALLWAVLKAAIIPVTYTLVSLAWVKLLRWARTQL